MATPLEAYKPVHLGASNDATPMQKPEKYFWSIFRVAIGTIIVAALFYAPGEFPYRSIVRIVGAAAFVAVIVSTIVRYMRERLTRTDADSHIALFTSLRPDAYSGRY